MLNQQYKFRIDTQIYTYQEIWDITNKIATLLQIKYNIQYQTSVAIQAQNSIHYLFIIIALHKLKAIAIPINNKYPQATTVSILQNLHISILLVDYNLLNIDSSFITLLNINNILQEANSLETYKIDFDIDYTIPSNIILTSGSSGLPKAVTHCLNNHIYSAIGSNENIPFTKEDSWLITLPLFHVSGLSILYRTILSSATCVLSDIKFPNVLFQHDITHISLAPTQLIRALEDKKNIEVLQNLKVILLGGAAVPPFLLQKCKKYNLNICCSYGSSEMSSQITTTSYNQIDYLPYNSGFLLPHRELKISKDNEILVKGKTLFMGYASYNPHFKKLEYNSSVDKDGWFYTNDLGKINEDSSLIVLGRKDSMFICAGENIQPEEIENYIYKYSFIEKVIVIPQINMEYGSIPIAYIATVEKNISIDHIGNQISIFLEQYLPKLKIPKAYYQLPNQYLEMKINRKQFIKEHSKIK